MLIKLKTKTKITYIIYKGHPLNIRLQKKRKTYQVYLNREYASGCQGCRCGERGEGGQRVQTSSYELNKF